MANEFDVLAEIPKVNGKVPSEFAELEWRFRTLKFDEETCSRILRQIVKWRDGLGMLNGDNKKKLDKNGSYIYVQKDGK